MEKEFTSFIQEAGFLWGPSPEIYGGLAGFYTYGPLGKLLKNKVENSVRETFEKEGFGEIEAPTILPDIVWKASGHLETFNDRTISCSKCKSMFRADNLIEEKYNVSADTFSDKKILEFIKKKKIVCPTCKGWLNNKIETKNLMMKTKVGGQEASLRPETATVTYLPFKRMYNYFRKKLPFGVFQIGKVYRNEISPRQHVLRGREFTQAEGQIFIDPKEKNKWNKYKAIKNKTLPLWDHKNQKKESPPKKIKIEEAIKKGLIKSQAYAWCLWLAYKHFRNFGIPEEKIRIRQHFPNEKAFYAEDAWDIEVKLNNYGWIEMCGVHDRADYDLKQHSKHSKEKLEASRENGEKFTPHILEIAFGTDRATYTLLDLFYEKKDASKGKSTFKIPYHMAPIEVSILPLMKKEELLKISKDVSEDLSKEFTTSEDSTGSIGKRYLRNALSGTPYTVTIDFDSIKKKDVTLRDRDTEEQKRIKIKDLRGTIKNLFEGNLLFKKIK